MSVETPTASATRIATGSRGYAVTALVLLFGVLTWRAHVQQPHPDPTRTPTLGEWLRYPIQRNAHDPQVVQSNLTAVYALPGTGRVWAVGNGGMIVYSTDAGRSWHRGEVAPDSSGIGARAVTTDTTRAASGADSSASVPVSSPLADTTRTSPAAGRAASTAFRSPLVDVFFVDSAYGWALSALGEVLATGDGGRSWRRRGSIEGRVVFQEGAWIRFVDQGLGYATLGRARDGGTFVTPDSGRTWTPLPTDESRSLFVADTTTTNLLLFGGGITRWTYAGQPQPVITPVSDRLPFSLSRTELHFPTTQRGWAVVPDSARDALYGTADGGRTWNRLSRGLPLLKSLEGDSARGLVGVGVDGSIIRSPNGGRAWDTVRTEPGYVLNDVVLDGDGLGWAVGDGGTILSTRDGGETWRTVRSDTRLADVDFAPGTGRGWAAGRGGMVLATRDGGATWKQQRSPTRQPLRALAFVGDGHVWAVGDSATVITTRDGGRRWERLPLRLPDSLAAVDFQDVFFQGGQGWITTGFRGVLLATTDSGANWRIVRPASLRASSIRFDDGEFGWAVGQGHVWTSPDGGASWRHAGGTNLLRAWFINAQTGWAVRVDGRIAATRDGGARWTLQELPEGVEGVVDLRFRDEQVGWAVGRRGTVLRTLNGGRRWTRVDSLPRVDLYALEARDGEVWAAGSGGVVLRGDGERWQAASSPLRWPAPWYYLAGAALLAALAAIARMPPSAARRQREEERSIADLLIPDRPLRPGDPDPFELNALALGIARFLQNPNTEPPLTLAVTGRWGTGKSSLMNLVRCNLRDADFRPVWFNAWHHQQEEHLLACLLESIRSQAVPPPLSGSGMAFRLKLFLIRTRDLRPSVMVLYVLLLLIAGMFYQNPSWMLDLLDSGRKEWGVIASGGIQRSEAIRFLLEYLSVPLAAALALSAALWRSLAAFQLKPGQLLLGLTRAARFRDLQEKTGFRYRFAQEFREVTEALRPRDMVIFVDDLDRCRPEQVLQVLEAVNFLVSSGECTVVMGLDRSWVTACVGLEFDRIAQESAHLRGEAAETADDAERARLNRARFAGDYLDKLINIEVPVPVPTSAQRRELVHAGLERRARDPEAADRARTVRRRDALVPRLVTYGVAGALSIALGVAMVPRVEQPALGGALISESVAPPSDTTITPPGDTVPPAPSLALVRSPASLVDLPEPRRSIPVPAAAMAVLLAGAVVVLLQAPRGAVRDSAEFTSSLKAWSGVVASQGLTPRATKKFLNRLRFYAMRMRAHEPPETRWTQLTAAVARAVAALRAWWHRRDGAAKDGDATPSSAPPEPDRRQSRDEDGIPEPVLVALATLQQCSPDGVVPRGAWSSFHEFVERTPLTSDFREEILAKEFGYPTDLSGYRERFEEISREVRIR
ncbi:MAG TPA: YCF48-related protein [Longimicrobium sp.]